MTVANLFIKYRAVGISGTLLKYDLYLRNVIRITKKKIMLKRLLAPAIFILVLITGNPFQTNAQTCDPITRSQLKEMLIQLGFEVKVLEATPGKEKFEVKHVKDGFNVPVGYEISASTNYIWLTVNLGNKFDDYSSKNAQLIRQNGIIQPCQFYVTESGRLMMGLAIENRGVNNALLRNKIETITAKVAETNTYWKSN